MKQRAKLSLLLCFIIANAAPVLARSTKTVYHHTRFQQHGSIAEIAMNIDDTSRNAPLEELAAATKTYPTVLQFKVSWRAVVGGGNYKGTAVYNRPKQTVELYAYETFEEKVIWYHRQYFAVSEPILNKAAQQHKIETADDNGISVFGFFNDLTKYGCKQRKLDGK